LKSRLIGLASVIAIAVGVSLTAAGPAEAATPAIQITKVYYNSPGTDTGSNTSLNAEWVRLTNTRTYTINLRSWTLRDKAGHVYTFTTNYYIGSGKRAYIHTGKGTNGSPDYQHRYWGRSWYVWNNNGDTAYVRNPSGTLIDSCSWGSSGSYTYC
jgi:Lamin Tail Domain